MCDTAVQGHLDATLFCAGISRPCSSPVRALQTAMRISAKAQVSLGDDWALQEGKRQSLITAHYENQKIIAQQAQLLTWYKELKWLNSFKELYNELHNEPQKKKQKEGHN